MITNLDRQNKPMRPSIWQQMKHQAGVKVVLEFPGERDVLEEKLHWASRTIPAVVDVTGSRSVFKAGILLGFDHCQHTNTLLADRFRGSRMRLV